MEYSVRAYDVMHELAVYESKLNASWNQVFATLSPALINEASEHRMTTILSSFVGESGLEDLTSRHPEIHKISTVTISRDSFETVKIQLRALGLIEKSVKQRSLKDTETYWKLTPYGDKIMTQLRAIRKPGQ